MIDPLVSALVITLLASVVTTLVYLWVEHDAAWAGMALMGVFTVALGGVGYLILAAGGGA